MDSRFYNSRDINIERVAQDVVSAFSAMGYEAQKMVNGEQVMVQLRKGSDLEAWIGTQAVLSLTLQRTSGGIVAVTGRQKWVNKAATGAAGLIFPPLWPLALTTGFGVVRQIHLANQVLNMVDGLVRQQAPDVQPGPAPEANPNPNLNV